MCQPNNIDLSIMINVNDNVNVIHSLRDTVMANVSTNYL